MNPSAIVGLILLCSVAASATGQAAEKLYVAPEGKDTNPGTQRAPLATLQRARDVLRERRKTGDLTGGVTVVVKAGSYRLTEPLVFTPQDSGTEQGRIAYVATPPGAAVLVGSVPITGWKPFRNGIYQADLSGVDLRGKRFWQLYYRGQWQILARYPNFDPEHPRSGGFLYMGPVVAKDSKVLLRYKPGKLDPTRWAKPTAVRVHIWPWLNWNRNILPVKSIDAANHVITLARPASYKLIEGNRFFIENALEELDAPGEWFLDEDAKTLYFRPPDGQRPEGRVSVPVLDGLIQFHGDAAKAHFVGHLELRGFRLAETRRHLVELNGAAHCTVAACTIEHCGGTAVSIRSRSHHNRVIGCDIAHVGGSAVIISGTVDWEHKLEGQPAHNLISNNHVHDVGEQGNAWGAIMINPGCGGNCTHDNVISHNLVHDTPRQGITFNGFRNIVEYNHVHHTNQEQSDTGAIGMGSRDIYERGSVVRYNYVHDTGGYNMLKPGVWEYPHYCWGIYLDDYTSGVHVYGNVVVRTYRGGVMVHGGQDNVIENNIIVDGLSQQIQYAPIDHLTSGRTPGHPDKSLWLMTGTKLIGNVFSFDGKKSAWVWGRKWEQILAESDRNLIWPRGGTVRMNLGGVTDGDYWAAWRKLGFDAHSVIADPQFVNPARDDYRLKPTSPAFKLGFKPIPVEKIGPYQSPDRASWPLKDEVQREQHLRYPEGKPAGASDAG